jgi:hypothetical protein
LYLSRLSRNNADWFPLIEMCGLTRTLIADEEGIYDPNDANDRLLLGLKGTISEAEVQRIYSQLHGARWSKARRGELRRRLPTGYIYDEGERVVIDPDERVRHALRSFFERFEQVGSACGVTRSYNREGLLFPTRWYRGKWDGPVRWHTLSVRQATMILHNPVYAGAYFYGERRSETRLDPETKTRKTVVKHLPMEEWEVLIHDAHPAYISWEQFMRNREKLKDNCSPRGGAGAVRSGASLLQGIVCCGRCGRQMAVQYHGRKSYPMYRCARHTKTGESEYCCSIPAEGVDRWVEQQLLEAMRPTGIEAALGAVEELEKRSSALRQEWENRIEQAEYEATLARRRYEGVDPDNRLVAANLERDWEDKLREVEKVQKDFAERGARPPIWISQEDREKVRALSKDIPRLWRLKSTKQSDRKKVVRILIREVWLNLEDEPRQIKVWIHWQTGATTQGIIARPSPGHRTTGTSDDVVERIRELYAQSKSHEQIAEHLNREGLRTGRNNSFNAKRVHYVVRKSEINKTESKDREKE